VRPAKPPATRAFVVRARLGPWLTRRGRADGVERCRAPAAMRDKYGRWISFRPAISLGGLD